MVSAYLMIVLSRVTNMDGTQQSVGLIKDFPTTVSPKSNRSGAFCEVTIA